VATVSRVLNDYPDVSPATRERVLAGIREHDFSPNRAARSLSTGRTHVIGVFFETGVGRPDLQHPFFQEVLAGMRGSLGASGYDLLLFSSPDTGNGSGAGAGDPADRERHRRGRFLARARQHRVDGVVLMGVDRGDPGIEELVSSGTPTVAIDLDLAGGRTGNVTSDNVRGAGLAVRHLAELGHRRIALIGGPHDTRPGVDRLLGYRRELKRLDIPARPEYVREGDFYPASGRAAMAELLDLAEPPSAVVAASDLMAAGAIRALSERGSRCPDEVSVVGFDDIQMAALLQPPLTTIRQDKHEMGTAAATALVGMVEDPELTPPVVVVDVGLVVRGSTAAVPHTSSIAVRFERGNS
jgi:LacI family transcriptional regulator